MSLRDQLLKSGAATQSQHQRARTEKKKYAKQKKLNPHAKIDDEKSLLNETILQKKERDKALNQQKNAERKEKAIIAEVRQWVKDHAITRTDTTVPYRFAHDHKIKTLYLSQQQIKDIVRGMITIASIDIDQYVLLPSSIALKIAAKMPAAVIVNHCNTEKKIDIPDEDPYAGYDIPDDLIW
ncbi:MAG: DUF2058 domain-containing protein [Endozoicomonadaceae bacterium]|nr:DUF2058 domain-containing protein [Endozoicomonadaceae bacterium]